MRLHIDALALVTMPLIFTQDQLLTSAQFSREAEQIGIRVDEALLQALHSGRHLLPLFRIDDEAVVGRQLSIHQKVRQNSPRGWVLDAAREGRLRDPALEGYSVAWPYQRPDDVDPRQWWNGFVYSSWQLLDLADMSWELSTAKRDFWRDGTVRSSVSVDPPWSPAAAKQRRARTVTLAAIANRFLVNIVGHASLPAGESWNDLWQTADDLDLAAAVARVGVDPADLLPLAEQLLFSAHGHDPLRDWLPLVRWADYRAWDRLRGAAQLAIRQRMAAEVLLRAHDLLAESGLVDALPDYSGAMVWYPLADRLGESGSRREGLDAVLADFGLSPHPRVLLLVEGQSELLIVERLLQALRIPPTMVRAQVLGGDAVSPNLLARHVVSPQLGAAQTEGWLLAAPLTALFIVTDPGGMWSPARRDRSVAAIRNTIRSDVERQGGRIDDETLDLLVTSIAWTEACYECSNFSDDELVDSLTAIAERNGVDTSARGWADNVRRDLGETRTKGTNIEPALRHALADKIEVAEELWRVLNEKLPHEREHGLVTPLLVAVDQAIMRAGDVPRGTVILPG